MSCGSTTRWRRSGWRLRRSGVAVSVMRCRRFGPRMPVRSWVTVDVFCGTDAAFQWVNAALSMAAVGRLYRVAPERIDRYELPGIRVVKFSFPRPVPQGSRSDPRHARRAMGGAAGRGRIRGAVRARSFRIETGLSAEPRSSPRTARQRRSGASMQQSPGRARPRLGAGATDGVMRSKAPADV